MAEPNFSQRHVAEPQKASPTNSSYHRRTSMHNIKKSNIIISVCLYMIVLISLHQYIALPDFILITTL
jgi:hypothetical protein